MADVPVALRLELDSKAVKKVLRGIQKDMLKTEMAVRKEIEKTEQTRTRSFQRQKSQIDQLGKAFKDLGRSGARELEQNIFSGVKKGIQRSRDFLRKNKGALAIGALTGAGAGARSAYQRGSNFLGLPTQASAFQSAIEYRTKFQQFANAAGMSPSERQAFMGRVAGKSKQTGAFEGDILSGAARVQAAMGPSGLQAYEAQLDNLLNINQALGAPLDDLSGVLVELNRQFGLSADQWQEALGFMVEAANEGSIEVTDFSSTLREAMGAWASTMGAGMNSFKQFVAVAEAGGTTYDPAKVSVSMERGAEILDLLRGTKEGRKLGRKYGLDFSASPIEIGRQLRERNIGTEALKEIFPDVRSRRLFRTLRDQGGVAENLLGLPGAAGLERVSGQAAEFRGSALGQVTAQRAAVLRNVNAQFEDVAFWANKVAGQFQELASKNVLLSQKLGVAIDAIIATGVVLGAKHVITGGAKKAAEKAIETAATVGGATTGGATAGGAVAGGASGMLGGALLGVGGIGVGALGTASVAAANQKLKRLSGGAAVVPGFGFGQEATRTMQLLRASAAELNASAQASSRAADKMLDSAIKVGRAE